MQRDGHNALVVAPVSWETLTSRRRRREYLELCRRLPPDPARRLCFSVCGMPGELWQTPIAIRFAALAPFARFLFAYVASDPSRAEPFAGTRPTR